MKPRTVKVSVLLWIAVVVLQFASSLLALVDVQGIRADLMAEVAQGFPAEATTTQERVVVAVLALLLGAGLLIALLELGFVVALNRRKRWARVVLALLAGAAAVHGVIVVGGLRSVYLVGLLVAAGIAVGAVVASFAPASREWFGGKRTATQSSAQGNRTATRSSGRGERAAVRPPVPGEQAAVRPSAPGEQAGRPPVRGGGRA